MSGSAVAPQGIVSRAFTALLAVGFGVLLFPYLSGMIGAAVLYVVALPLVQRLDPSRRHRWAPLLSMFLVFVLIVLPGLALAAELLSQIPEAARSVQHSPVVTRLMSLELGDVNLGELARLASAQIVGWSSEQTITAIGGVLSAALNLVIALFGAYYLLTSRGDLWERTKSALPFNDATSELLRARFISVTEATLIGVVLTCASQGTLVGFAFAALGLPQPVLWGAVTAVVSLVPMVGSALVWLPAALILVAQDRVAGAVVLFVLGALLISNIDNALRIVVYRRVSHFHPMITLLGAFAGVRAFGVAGLLIGPLLISFGLELVKVYRANGAILVETG